MCAEGARMLLGCPSLGSGGCTAHFSPPESPPGDFLWENCRGKEAEDRNPPQKGLGSAQGVPRAQHFLGVVQGSLQTGSTSQGIQAPWQEHPAKQAASATGLLGSPRSLRQNACVFQRTQRLFLLLRCRVGLEDTHRAFLVPPPPSTQPRESFCFSVSSGMRASIS